MSLFRVEGREPGGIHISCHTETYGARAAGKSGAFCTDRNNTVGLYPGDNVQRETDRETESRSEQKGQQDAVFIIALVQSHFKNYIKLAFIMGQKFP
jgi:hypothetical protein